MWCPDSTCSRARSYPPWCTSTKPKEVRHPMGDMPSSVKMARRSSNSDWLSAYLPLRISTIAITSSPAATAPGSPNPRQADRPSRASRSAVSSSPSSLWTNASIMVARAMPRSSPRARQTARPSSCFLLASPRSPASASTTPSSFRTMATHHWSPTDRDRARLRSSDFLKSPRPVLRPACPNPYKSHISCARAS